MNLNSAPFGNATHDKEPSKKSPQCEVNPQRAVTNHICFVAALQSPSVAYAFRSRHFLGY